MLKFTKASLLTAAVLAALSTGIAQAEDGAALYASKTCIACHGADGKTPIMPIYPKIAGQNEAYVLQQLKDIKAGTRNNGMSAAMTAIMATVSDEEVAILAKYVAEMK